MEGAGTINENTNEINPVFARHETFHPRFGWLKKGFDKVSEDATLFRNDNASVVLGVGKNMVKSIKYWCNAFKLLENSEKNKGFYQTTPFAFNLLDDGGRDPFLEDPASLWLLHWQLLNQAHEGLVQTKTRRPKSGDIEKGGNKEPGTDNQSAGDANRHGILGSG